MDKAKKKKELFEEKKNIASLFSNLQIAQDNSCSTLRRVGIRASGFSRRPRCLACLHTLYILCGRCRCFLPSCFCHIHLGSCWGFETAICHVHARQKTRNSVCMTGGVTRKAGDRPGASCRLLTFQREELILEVREDPWVRRRLPPQYTDYCIIKRSYLNSLPYCIFCNV